MIHYLFSASSIPIPCEDWGSVKRRRRQSSPVHIHLNNDIAVRCVLTVEQFDVHDIISCFYYYYLPTVLEFARESTPVLFAYFFNYT